MIARFKTTSWWALVCALAACGDNVKIIECPPGTLPDGSRCVPIGEPDTSGGDTVVQPDTSETTEPVDTHVDPDTTATTDTTTTTATDGGSDAGDTSAAGPTGAACLKNADCEGGTCLDWNGGYCTALGCTAQSCGADATCITFQGNAVCVASCSSDSDCRVPDQACKSIIDGSTVTRACVGVDESALPIGGRCADATDCTGAATCLGAFPGGYCASLGCPADACATGSTCVTVDGRPSCLRRCTGDLDCDSQVGAERKCGVLPGQSGAPAEVCISGVTGKTLGETCLSDFECGTGVCQILGEGRCSQTQRPCFAAHEADDCNGAEFCVVNGQNRVGLCSQPCRAGGVGCPGASYCVSESDNPNDAWCRPSCTTSGADPACNASAGLFCAFGIPLTDGAQGRFVCGRARTGVLTTCNGNAACGDNTCLLDGASGYCTEPCGDDSYCPFGGACVTNTSQGDRCQRACFSGADCPASFDCTLPSGATRSVCTP